MNRAIMRHSSRINTVFNSSNVSGNFLPSIPVSSFICRVTSSASTASVETGLKDGAATPPTSNPLPISQMPGPGGFAKLPYIGPLFLFHPFSVFKPETYGKLVNALHDKFGPIFKTRHGKNYAVHTSCIEDINTIFQGEPQFPSRRLNDLSRVYRQRRGLPQGLSTSNGPEWYALRKALNAPLNRPKSCMEYLPAQNKVSDDLVNQLLWLQDKAQGEEKSSENLAQATFDLLFRFSAESVAVVCFNERLGFLTDGERCSSESKQLLDAIHTHLNSSFMALIGLERKYMQTENDPFYQNYATAVDTIRAQASKYVEKTMASTRSTTETSDSETDFLNGKDVDNENKNLLLTLTEKTNLDIDRIVAIIESLLIAGTDSTARNLSVLLYHLTRHPDIQTRLIEEVLCAIGPDGPVTQQSLGQMNLLKACFKESMRLFPPISPGTERGLPEDTILSGYLVPAGTSVIMTSVRTSRDHRFFPDPDSFKPDRWMRTSTSSSGGKTSNLHKSTESDGGGLDPRLAALSFLPFGHGKRSCVGRRFAELEVFVCVAKIVQKLKVTIDPEYPELDAIYTPFVTPVKPVPFIFTEHGGRP